MKAGRNAPPSVQVVDVDEPEGEGELVRVLATGISASDLKYLRWGSTQIACHEFAGVLEDGTPGAVESFFGCGTCAQCEQGTYNMCTAVPIEDAVEAFRLAQDKSKGVFRVVVEPQLARPTLVRGIRPRLESDDI